MQKSIPRELAIRASVVCRARAGFTVVELIVVLLVVATALCVFLPLFSHHRDGARDIKDSTQVRGIAQALVLWRQSNDDQYVLPSLLDTKNDTISEVGAAKNTTANIVSILIYNGFIGPELCVSPAEANDHVKVFENYSYSRPPNAANPNKSMALWDPSFTVDFTGGRDGAFSYAHLPPADERLRDWRSNYDANTAIMGNRGPQIASVSKGKEPAVTAIMAKPDSNTLLIHGGRTTWEGSIAYNDIHVTFETSMAPKNSLYRDKFFKPWNDCLFFNEPEDPKRRNNFLGMFIKAGDTLRDFQAIWD